MTLTAGGVGMTFKCSTLASWSSGKVVPNPYSHASRYQMSLPTVSNASDQDYTLELQKFIEDLSQIPERTPVVSELEGMLNSKVQKF